jgi:very-short-patch-repair endonuclease
VSEWHSSPDVWHEIADAARDNRKAPTAAEARLWQALRGRKLEGWRFRRQHAIQQFIVDFYCAEAGLIVEVDGAYHAQIIERDTERTAALEAPGFRVLRFENQQVLEDLDSLLNSILLRLQTRPPHPAASDSGPSA